MDSIYILKALIIGIFGAGGFYFLISFVFMYFPMPMFLYVRERVLTWASKKHKKTGDRAGWAWSIVRFLLISLMLITWWGIFGAYAICLHQMLSFYLPDAGDYYWPYYAIAITLPAIWVIVQFIRFFFENKEEDLFPIEEDERPLFDQMIRQEPR